MTPLALLDDPTALGLRLLASYLLGAIPFGWLLARGIRGVDLREVGSGNIGATNAMRALGTPLGLLAFAFDVGKGWAPAALLAGSDPRWMVACGAAAICGHVWPVYLGFKGGKAVATSCGALFAIDPGIVVGAGIGWIVVLLATSYVGLASVVMGVLFPVLAQLRSGSRAYGSEVVIATSVLALLILIRHRSNMARIVAGTEPRSKIGFGGRKKVNGNA